MRGFIGNTDYDWYRFLAAQPDVDEVNFWQPSGGGGRFGAVSAGEPFFFRLKSPHNAIAGFGYFASYSALPAWLAWESFGRTNGLLLRSDIHRLFDLGYVMITPEYRFKVSDSLAEEFHEVRTYYAERDRHVVVPDAEWMRPTRELLEWHGESVWRG